MKIKFYAPEWGNTLPFDQFCQRVKAAGYDGVEMALPFEPKEKESILENLAKYGLELIGQYWQSIEADIDAHAANYEKYLTNLIAAKPIFINCQTGKDYFSFDQNERLFGLASSLSDASGIRIIHETHRGKSLFAAHITKDYLTKIPSLRIALDISHWCNVHESLLEDQAEAVALAIAHTDHIHSRVGHPEGPQVNDPRASEWESALEAHLKWWDQVVAAHQKNATQLTITTEFGPAPYMPSLPHTQMPIANQWEINVYMMELLKARYYG
ncbi:sugar phosphate isomerase/epimerase [Dyadobacter sp. CY326]|uniref:sugar phosphate isomerase/epimerase family protein n=1 Tax=Dyadobacter sp. CY326 TaxID=2907300 RepID=UPI001F381575|nr:sugar phosphate isomerase/epimerase [Dyadobacter sp. CY326]MCE7064605.1 sugar phosphate isomerase/epimerase [Dyadobacter sp. CY326]